MAIRDGSTIPEAFVDAPTETAVGSVVSEGFVDAPTTTNVASVIVEVFKTFGCVATPVVLPTATHRLIRRVRRVPHLSVAQVRQFFARLQVDLQAGVGLAEGQGEDPLVVLRWSDDGGHTWSNAHPVTAGRLGEYKRRAIWRRLGTARTRVFEISVSDPVAWRVLDAYLDVELGGQ